VIGKAGTAYAVPAFVRNGQKFDRAVSRQLFSNTLRVPLSRATRIRGRLRFSR